MAVKKNTSDLLAQAASTLPDNTTQEISPQDSREMAENIAFSSFNKITDTALVGLKEYSTIPTYEAGQGCINGGSIYISNKVTGPGVFAPADWDILTTITPAQASAITANTAKVTNATHTGEVTGSGALTVQTTLISGKTVKSTLAGTEELLINDGGTLKKVLASNFGGDTIFTGGTMSSPSTIAMGGNDLTFDGGKTIFRGDIQINEEISTRSSLPSQIHSFGTDLPTGLSRFFWYNNVGLAGYIDLLGTAGTLGGNSLMQGAFRVTSGGNANKFIIGNGNPSSSTYFIWGGAENANTDGKWDDSGLLIGNGIGASSPAANLHVTGEGNSNEKAFLVQSNFGNSTMIDVICNNSIALLGATLGGANTLTVGGSTQIKSSGSTSATTALLVQNSLGTDLLEVKDDGSTFINGKTQIYESIAGGAGVLKIENPDTGTNSGSGAQFWSNGKFTQLAQNGPSVGDWSNRFTMNQPSTSDGYLFIAPTGKDFKFGFNNGTNSNVDFKLNETGLLLGAGVGASSANASLQVRGKFLVSDSVSDTPLAQCHIKGEGATNTTTALLVQNDDTIPLNILEIKDDGSLFSLGLQGFTGTGAYTNFTITNGIITAAS